MLLTQHPLPGLQGAQAQAQQHSWAAPAYDASMLRMTARLLLHCVRRGWPATSDLLFSVLLASGQSYEQVGRQQAGLLHFTALCCTLHEGLKQQPCTRFPWCCALPP
jgi:hypothetical protein